MFNVLVGFANMAVVRSLLTNSPALAMKVVLTVLETSARVCCRVLPVQQFYAADPFHSNLSLSSTWRSLRLGCSVWAVGSSSAHCRLYSSDFSLANVTSAMHFVKILKQVCWVQLVVTGLIAKPFQDRDTHHDYDSQNRQSDPSSHNWSSPYEQILKCIPHVKSFAVLSISERSRLRLWRLP